MDSLMISAASGMRARMESLDMLANNLANAATAGYKSDREMYSLYVAPEALDPALAGESPLPSTLPVVEHRWTDFGLARSAAFDTDSLSTTRPIEYEVITAAVVQGSPGLAMI